MARSPDPHLRQTLLGAARHLFATEGLDAVSMRKIAQAANCSATAIYLHFPDKQALVEELALTEFLDLAQAFLPLADLPDPVERLRAMGRAYADFALARPETYRFLFMTPKPQVSHARSRLRNQPQENAYLLLRAVLSEALETGRFREEFADPDLLAQTLLCGVHGVVALHISNFQDPWVPWRPVQGRVDTMLDALFRGLLKGGSR
jgi:AcrR family transcriptional regulator